MVKNWDAAYQEQHTPWDLRGPTPPLEMLLRDGFLERLGVGVGMPVAVPGCGRGHDLKQFAELDYRVTGFDIAPRVVAEAQALLQLNRIQGVEVLCRDVLALVPEFAGQFRLVYDYTCFCALPMRLRAAYARSVAGILQPGGFLLMLAFPLGGPMAGLDRPPFLIRETELRETYDGLLQFKDSFEPLFSSYERRGDERWYLWQKPADTANGTD